MTSRDRIFATINQKRPDRIPLDGDFQVDIWAKLASHFGSKICLHGTISCQQALPFGTPDDVASKVRQRIECCGTNGGLILAPSNTVQPDVPLENLLALYTTAKNLML